MYTMGTVLRHGSEEQKRRYLPSIASGELRLQVVRRDRAEAGTDTTQDHDHRACASGDRYVDQRPEDLHLARRSTPT